MLYKKLIVMLVGIMCIISITSTSFGDNGATQIGEVECIKRVLQGSDTIKILRIEDPDNPFVSLYFTTIKSGKFLAMADPSNTSIAARLIGDIPIDSNGNFMINKSTNYNIESVQKSIGTKIMKIARYYDEEKNVLVYLVYTTKMLDGSLKHSLSVVPLGKPLTK